MFSSGPSLISTSMTTSSPAIFVETQTFLFGWCPVDEFILKHKATLHKLELRDCEMYVPHAVDPHHWLEVYKQFQTELTKLEEFVVVISAWQGESSRQGYSRMGDELNFYTVKLTKKEVEDAVALGELHTVVDLRRLGVSPQS